jgi:16S rRNA (cytosine967-C5)-methyltransferase
MLAGLLHCALALLDTPEGEKAPYEAFTVVDQAVTRRPRTRISPTPRRW